MFHDYMQQFEAKDFRKALIELFEVLDTQPEDRDDYMDEDLAAFPYVNGGMFAGEIEIPRITEEIRGLILQRASDDFDWSLISPTIFGAVFESTLNPETRRAGGMHYTSIENIHKVIDPLFLNDLKAELADIKATSVAKTKKDRAYAFQNKLAGLKFFDPACGSGNFLTESYTSLRRLENEALRIIYGSDRVIGEFADPIKVSINQFYGIEINDFACSVAQTALWIAEAQMMQETDEIVGFNLDPLPLKTYTNIHEGNALRMDWNDVIPASELNYIMGNPPFVGYSWQTDDQKDDVLSIVIDKKGKPYKSAGRVDYVVCWYFKAARFMEGASIKAAFVSTNSITQGEQVAAVWKPLKQDYGVRIDFAWTTFIWDSEANLKAHVHCVIIGFSLRSTAQLALQTVRQPIIYDAERATKVTNINGYLIDAEDVYIENRTSPICNVPSLINGGKPTEGGFLILTEEERDSLLSENPLAQEFIRPYMMGKDFIDRKPRFCLWLVHANPSVLRKCPKVLERIEQVRTYRLESPKAATRKKAETPQLFDEVRECSTDYVAIPKVSSQNRRYIPMEYLSKEIIPGDKLFGLPNATLYELGVLTSSAHMAWMRVTCGRLKSDYSYSNTIVYNNFPWPRPTEPQKQKIEQTAQAILDARALYPGSSLADLYDELAMPVELRRAHRANDAAVLEAYGFSKDATESDIVARLFKMYQELTK